MNKSQVCTWTLMNIHVCSHPHIKYRTLSGKHLLYLLNPFKNVSSSIEMCVTKLLVEADVFGVGYGTCYY